MRTGQRSLLRRRQRGRMAIFLLILTGMTLILLPISGYLKSLSGEIAISDAIDLITLVVNDSIHRMMAEGQYDYDYFVTLEKDNAGDVTAIKTNMARINTLSAELLQDVVDNSNNGVLEIDIPLGNLLGANLLLGRGPDVPVRIIMLTSSYADFRNELVSAGINQTKHQIILEVMVDVDVLVPWETLSTRVVSEVLIAETIIVGNVPETYLKVENPNES